MNDPADLDRLAARIRGELRAERERGDPARAALDQELRRIRGQDEPGSMSRFLLGILISVLFLFAIALFWPRG